MSLNGTLQTLISSLSMSAMGGEADMPGPRFKVGS